jgi:hypothetical protein
MGWYVPNAHSMASAEIIRLKTLFNKIAQYVGLEPAHISSVSPELIQNYFKDFPEDMPFQYQPIVSSDSKDKV